MSESIQSVEKVLKPQEVRTAVRILWVFMIIGLAVGLYTMVSSWDVIMAQAGKDLDADAKHFAAIFAGVVAVIGMLISLAISGTLYFLISRGHNWARIVVLVLFIIGLPFSLISILASLGVSGLPAFSTVSIPMPIVATIVTVVHIIASAYALCLLFSAPATTWFKTPKERRGL